MVIHNPLPTKAPNGKRNLNGYGKIVVINRRKNKMNIIADREVLEIMRMKMEKAKVIFHPDGDNTFAAYQIILPEDKWEIWINARNADIINSGRLINRL